jgi:hypothetical protein
VVTRSGRDGASRLLDAVVRTLPADRGAWGQAMKAELASIDPTAARRSFAWGCLRATTAQNRMLRGGVHLLALLAAVAAVFGWAAAADFPPMAWTLDIVVAVLAAASWQGRRSTMLGPIGDGAAAWLLRLGGYLLAGVIVVAAVSHLHPASQTEAERGNGPLLVAVLVVSYLLGFATVSARRSAATARVLVTGAACGLAAAAIWLATVVLAPPIPPSAGWALILTMIASIVAAGLNAGTMGSPQRGLLAALLASAIASALIAILVVVLATYAPPSLIPAITPHALPADRVSESRIEIVDPYIALVVLGCVLAATLAAVSVATRRPAVGRLGQAAVPTR